MFEYTFYGAIQNISKVEITVKAFSITEAKEKVKLAVENQIFITEKISAREVVEIKEAF